MTLIQKIAAGLVALVAVSGAGAAVAATQLRSPQQESQAVVNDAARQLGVTPERLSTALKTALKNRVDAEVTAGRLTKAEGDALKARIDQNEVPLFGPGGRHHGPGHFGRDSKFRHVNKLEAAAKYLGMTEAGLREALDGGKTLAQVARDRDKSVDGLVDALLVEPRKRIEEDVKDGRLNRAEANEFLAGLRERTTAMVNGRMPAHPGRGFHRFRPGMGAATPMTPAF
jgi:hypothetical protein